MSLLFLLLVIVLLVAWEMFFVLVIHLLVIGCYCFIGCLGEFFVLVIHLLVFGYWLFSDYFGFFLSYLLLVAWDSWPSLNLCEKQCSTSVSGT